MSDETPPPADPIASSYPLASAGAQSIADATAETLVAFEARLRGAPVDELAALAWQFGDLQEFMAEVGFPTIDRVVRETLLAHGRSDFEVAVRAHAREAPDERARVGMLRGRLSTVLTAEAWRADVDASIAAAEEAREELRAGAQRYADAVDTVRPDLQRSYDDAVAKLNAEFQDAVKASAAQHTAQLNAVLDTLRAALGAAAVDRALAFHTARLRAGIIGGGTSGTH